MNRSVVPTSSMTLTALVTVRLVAPDPLIRGSRSRAARTAPARSKHPHRPVSNQRPGHSSSRQPEAERDSRTRHQPGPDHPNPDRSTPTPRELIAEPPRGKLRTQRRADANEIESLDQPREADLLRRDPRPNGDTRVHTPRPLPTAL